MSEGAENDNPASRGYSRLVLLEPPPAELRAASQTVVPLPIGQAAQATRNALSPLPVTFDQSELRLIFGLYGKKVAAGEWRDYAMDFLKEQAIFSIYRRSSEVPLYRIEKTPKLARKQGQYAALAASGLILKRGSELNRVLAALDRPVRIVR